MRSRRTLTALTGLRFFAAIHVVCCHFLMPCVSHSPPWIQHLAGTGFVAVSLFFVLSGFVLVYAYLGDDGRMEVDRKAFWFARFARIYPVYLLGLVLELPFFLVSQMGRGGFVLPAVRTEIIGLLNVTLTQSWLPDAACRWNCPGWSLSDEAFFYAAFPLLLPLFARLPARRLVPIALALWLTSLAAAFALSRGHSLLGAEQDSMWALIKYDPLLRFPEFLVGMLVGRLYLAHQDALSSLRVPPSLVVVAAGVGIIAVLLVNTSLPYALVHNGLLTPLFALLIFALASGRGWAARILSLAPLVLLGDASYALYILHVPVHEWLLYLGREHGYDGWGKLPFFYAYLVLVIPFSVLVLWTIERPVRARLRRVGRLLFS